MDWDADVITPPVRSSSPAPLLMGLFAEQPNEVAVPDFGLFRDVLNSHFYPAAVEPLDPQALMITPRLSAIRLTHTTIGFVRFGVRARVDPGDLHAYHVNVPLRGSVISQCGDQSTVASPAVAAVFSPGKRTVLPVWDADAAQLCIKFDRHVVEREAADLLRRPGERTIDFRLAFPIDSGAGQRWLSLLSTLLNFAKASTTPADAYVVESLERSLICGLLVSQEHSLTRELHGDAGHRNSRTALEPIIEAMESAPDKPLTLADLCRLSSLSARSVQYAFQEEYGITPMRYLRRVRLNHARKDLRRGNGTVADIASYWGFSNLGRFAQAYKDQFGEFPSATLHPTPP
ncbi:AraC family transcriptional regulator [uncultured Jatrophihabitans sp.]|uniref:AraC family transcriptional regulator n=1 Tax=uncultured Jatrophihabitans sp. TaxID=1610747 RepID=UPI0035CA9A02